MRASESVVRDLPAMRWARIAAAAAAMTLSGTTTSGCSPSAAAMLEASDAESEGEIGAKADASPIAAGTSTFPSRTTCGTASAGTPSAVATGTAAAPSTATGATRERRVWASTSCRATGSARPEIVKRMTAASGARGVAEFGESIPRTVVAVAAVDAPTGSGRSATTSTGSSGAPMTRRAHFSSSGPRVRRPAWIPLT